MPSYNLQVFFKTLAGAGWSEHYRWIGSIDPSATIPLMTQLAQNRATLLASDCAVQWIRLQSNFKRDPLIFDFEANTSTVGPSSAATINTIDDAVLMRLEAPGVGFNRLFLRGIPDDCIAGQTLTPTPAWQTALTAYINYVVGSTNFAVSASVDNPITPVSVTSASQGAPKGIVIVVPNGTPFKIPATKVRISRASVFGYNGVKNIISNVQGTSPETILLGGAKPPANNPTTDNVLATPIAPQFAAVAQFFVERVTNRKAGRPFGLSRGRGQTRLSLRP